MASDEINLLIFSCSILVRLSAVTTGRLEGPLSTTTIKLQAEYPTHWRTNTNREGATVLVPALLACCSAKAVADIARHELLWEADSKRRTPVV